MSAETWWIVGCVVFGVIGLWLVLRGRRQPSVIDSDPRQVMHSVKAPPPPSIETPPFTTLSSLDHHVRKLAAEGNKIEAIKAVREHTSLGLKEAKDYVEAIPNVVPLANFGQAAPRDAAPSAAHALFIDANISELADSPMVRRAIERAYEKGMSESDITAMITQLTGKGQAEVGAMVARLKPSQSPIV